MREFRVGDKATWRGRDCTVVDRCPADLLGQTIMRVRLRWESGTRNGKPRMRYTWVPESRCVPVDSPTAAQEAASVGRRGQWSQRQDYTEAAALVTAKAAAPEPDPDALPVGWIERADGKTVRLDGGHHVWRNWVDELWRADIAHGPQEISGKYTTRSKAIAACEAWLAARATTATRAPKADACKTTTVTPAQEPKPAPCAGCADKNTWIDGLRERCNRMVRAVAERDRDLTAMRAECAAKDAKIKEYSDLLYRVTLITRAAGIESNDPVDEDVQQLVDQRDEATRLMADALCAKASVEANRDVLRAEYNRKAAECDEVRASRDETERVLSLSHAALASAGIPPHASLPGRIGLLADDREAVRADRDEARKAVEAAAADRAHLLDELRRATVQVNEAHDRLDAAGVAVDVSLAVRVSMLADERDERVLEVAALKRAAAVTWWDKMVRVFAGVAIAVAMLHGLEWWLR